MGIGWHPYFLLPSGDRKQARLHLPSQTRAVMNNYDDSFVTGKRVPVKGTPYDFSAAGGRPLGTQYLDDNYSNLIRNPEGSTVSEVIDPAAHYGLRLTTLSPQIRSIQVYAPPQKSFVAIEPQFNLPDPYSPAWGKIDTGMVLLKPGQSVSWRVRLELFKVIASMQPTHVLSDMRWAQSRLGPKRAATCYAWASFLNKGVTLAFGTDYNVEPISPFRGLYAAITRKSEDGKQEFFPEQRITMDQAIAAYTTGSAFAQFEERKKAN